MNTSKKKKTTTDQTDLAQKAYLGIRQMLFHNEIVPGQKIAYRDLAERLEMSPTPVIQALKFLEFQGLVRREPNRGYYTEPISLIEVREVFELREMLEVSLLPRALENLDEKGITRLKKAYEAHLATSNSIYPSERLLKNVEFHLTLASLSQCSIHQKVLQNLFDLMNLKYRSGVIYLTSMEMTDPNHEQLFEAITARELSKAQKLLTMHISDSRKLVIMGLERMVEEKKILTI
ncbi:HTH-type transcriptional regulator [Candidatus Vecturithrix granuli]|uniref:HTH-type transcriptional regulator n=1 Tax=Vecturithrix granuli TaxID=1499967 RepID=A0A081BXP5_VECG1|nr:HTH-type transcriptional regulator [Candidatus Vecturithrix granuli]